MPGGLPGWGDQQTIIGQQATQLTRDRQVNEQHLTDLRQAIVWLGVIGSAVCVIALGWPGVVRATVPVHGHTLWAFLNEQPGISTAGDTLELVPDALGTVRAIVAVSGYDLHEREFPVILARGTLTGHVDAAGKPGADARVRGYDQTRALVF